MALDKLIQEGENIGGLIESIILEPKEAMGLILEIIKLGVKYTKDMTILDADGVVITRAELIWAGKGLDKTEHVKDFINRWYKIQCTVTYKDIPLCVVKAKLAVPKPEKATGWTDPAPPKEEKKKKKEPPELNDVIKSWKLYDEPPEPPTPPPGRILSGVGIVGNCDKCGSSLKSKWLYWKGGGCIQPECENYWDK